jgi:hypothetical protein
MTPIVRSVVFLLFPVFVVPGVIQAEEGSTAAVLDEFSEWDAYLNETDLFLEEANDPLADLEAPDEQLVFWTFSLSAGAGHSTNFLKRSNAVSSPFIKTEADFILNAILEHSQLTALIFFEGIRYDEKAEVDQEAIVFLRTNWTEFRTTYSYGIEANVFYGDQIYDASLSVDGVATGASLRQLRPEIGFFGEWDMGSVDSLKTVLSLGREIIEDEDENYWRPGLSVEWNRVWTGSFGSRTGVSVYQEFYDDKVAHAADGSTILPETQLEPVGLQIEEVLTWKPVKWNSLSTSLRFGAAAERDSNDEYDALKRFWASFNGTLDLKFAKVGINGIWQDTRYDDRQVSSTDTRPVHQIYRTLQLEVEKDLRWNFSFIASVQWIEFSSRVSDDSFSERRVQALLDWTY